MRMYINIYLLQLIWYVEDASRKSMITLSMSVAYYPNQTHQQTGVSVWSSGGSQIRCKLLYGHFKHIIDWLNDWKFYLILVAHLVKYYFRWPSHAYTIYTHSYYYIYNIYTYYLQTKLLKLLKIDIIVFKIEFC